jgi:hypothetical protein
MRRGVIGYRRSRPSDFMRKVHCAELWEVTWIRPAGPS